MCCPCAAGWIAEGSEVPLDPAPLERLQQPGRPGGGLEGTGQGEAMKGCGAAKACQDEAGGRCEGDVCGAGGREAVMGQEGSFGWVGGEP